MIDGIVVVDSGQVIETTESAIIAKDEADRAEKWAKYSEEQANLASDNAIAAAASKEAAAQSAQSAANTVNGFDAHAAQKQTDFDNNATSKTNTYNSNASKKQAQVDASAEEARKWAVGTISEQHSGSAKYWAEQAKTVTAGTLNESILTNCLTEIPQDIKLELSNGTLTIKAGSKVYVPNGVGKFDVVTIQKDVGGKRTSTGQEFLLSDKNGAVAFWGKLYSGDSKPVDSGSYVWYDTANNVIKATTDGGASWLPEKFSLPLGIYTANGTGVTSIDQVFNGFGYIGNNTFILPGVKCKRTNGFNTDGSLNSIDTTFTRVTIPTFDTEVGRTLYFIQSDNTAISNFVSGNIYVYDKSINNFITRNTKEVRNLCFAYSVTKDSTGRITSLTPNTAFHAVDYSEFARALETKQDVISLTASRALVSDTGGNIAVSAVTSTELGYLDGVTSAIQTQLNGKALADLSNVTTAGKQAAVSWGLPNYAAGISATSPYTAPKAGFIIGIHNLSDNVFRSLTINSVEIYNTKTGAAYLGGQTAGFCYPVAKGDVVSWTNFNKMTFYPNKGA